jgi:hypothetical protein
VAGYPRFAFGFSIITRQLGALSFAAAIMGGFCRPEFSNVRRLVVVMVEGSLNNFGSSPATWPAASKFTPYSTEKASEKE